MAAGKCMMCGGTKKMAKGGATKGGSNAKMNIYGIPQENMGTSGQYGKMKKGGTVAPFAPNREVKRGCPGGYVRSADGGCVKSRPSEFKKTKLKK